MNGYIVDTKAVLRPLESEDAERTSAGEYIILSGDRPVYGLGGEEVILPLDSQYRKNGESVSLVDALKEKGEGFGPIVVI